MTSVATLGLKAAPMALTLAPERPYRLDAMAHLGPLNWEPYAAPELDCVDVDREHVRLRDNLGTNVLVILSLNGECVHCMQQLQAINKRAEDWLAWLRGWPSDGVLFTINFGVLCHHIALNRNQWRSSVNHARLSKRDAALPA
jgi:hypothetical protein